RLPPPPVRSQPTGWTARSAFSGVAGGSSAAGHDMNELGGSRGSSVCPVRGIAFAAHGGKGPAGEPLLRRSAVPAGRNGLGERSASGRRIERVGEVLGLVRYQAVRDLHDAERVGGRAVIGD